MSYNVCIGELLQNLLKIESGKITVCDPFTFSKIEELDADINPGDYSTVLSVMHLKEDGDERITAACINISENEVDRWETAKFKNGEEAIYSTDSGIGSFMDIEAAKIVQNDREYNATSFVGRSETAQRKNKADTWSWADVPTKPESDLNVLVFSSGWGDGSYKTYFGYDKDNNLSKIVTDFEVAEK